MNVEVEEAEWRPDLAWLSDNLAVGGCFPMSQTPDLAAAHGITAIVDLRDEACDDDVALKAAGIALLHLPTPDLAAPSQADLDAGVTFARERTKGGGKILIHCAHGIGRSAVLALCVLVDHGWRPLDALTHAKDRRENISPSAAQFGGWALWLERHGVTAPDYHSFGCIAYRHLVSR